MRLATASDKGNKPPYLETRFIRYELGIKDPKYKALREEREAAGIKCFCVIPTDKIEYGGERIVQLETDFIFDNQWNTRPDQYSAKGFRVFDWFEDWRSRERGTPTGHYLQITDEMRDIRKHTLSCRYCGHQYYKPDPEAIFCGKCLGSEHLKTDDLRMLRLIPISQKYDMYPLLTQEEEDFLKPLYLAAQLTLKTQKASAQRERVRLEHEKQLRLANMELAGFNWLLDREFEIDNVIFYGHAPQFGFGWRSGYDKAVAEELKKRLEHFPFPYEIKERG